MLFYFVECIHAGALIFFQYIGVVYGAEVLSAAQVLVTLP